MNNPQAEAQLFLYDLANLAKEHWFKPGEGWALSLANDSEKKALEKQYHPILNISGETQFLEKVATQMRLQLKIAEPAAEIPDERRARREPATYLLAYNPVRIRK
jgi:hypothetical protein